MRNPSRLLAASFALAGAATGWAGEVVVSVVEPERYTDAGDAYGAGSRGDFALGEIKRHLEQLGARHLGATQRLRVEVLDVDLAGHFEPWRFRHSDVRVLRDLTWPRITLRYTFEENGQAAASGEETVSDMNYLGRVSLHSRYDSLRYEKQMLDDWFRARFVERRAAAR